MRWIGLCLVLLAVSMSMLAVTGCQPQGAVDDGGDTGTGDDGGNDAGDDGGNDTGDDGGNDTGGDVDGSGGDGGDDQAPALIKTRIGFELDTSGQLLAGDDLVVYGTDDGIYYFTPSSASAETSQGTMIPGSDQLYNYRNFVVAGKKVVLVRSTGKVDVFDTVSGGNPVSISGGDITLWSPPNNIDTSGHMMADGNLVATSNDTEEVDDGVAMKVIDLSGATPEVISLANPEYVTVNGGSFDMVDIEATTRYVVAFGDSAGREVFFVWDLDNPDQAPVEFDLSTFDGVSDFVQFNVDGNYIMYRRLFSFDTLLLDVTQAPNDFQLIAMDPEAEYAADSPIALNGGTFGFFMAEEDVDNIQGTNGVMHRSVVGTVANAPAVTMPGQLGDLASNYPQQCVYETGKQGYGSEVCVTPDGQRIFISGDGPIGDQVDYLQMSTGGDFSRFEDTDTENPALTGYVMATDVSCSETTVVFRALKNTYGGACDIQAQWVLGFIVLDRLP